MVTPVVMSGTPVLENSSDRRPWEVRVVNEGMLLKAIASGAAPISIIKAWNETVLKDEAKRRGGLPPEWGCEAKQVTALSVRR